MGGKFLPRFNTGLIVIANKYHKGSVQRTLKRKLKGPEIVAMEANEINNVEANCCLCLKV